VIRGDLAVVCGTAVNYPHLKSSIESRRPLLPRILFKWPLCSGTDHFSKIPASDTDSRISFYRQFSFFPPYQS